MNSEDKFALTGKIILYTLPILAVAGVTLPLLFGQSNLSLLGSYLAVPMFFAPIIYLKYRQNPYKPINFGKRLFLLLLTIYFLCFSISVLLLDMFEVRPYLYYVIITVMATSILFEIILFDISQKKRIIILLQIIMLNLNIIWGVTLKYYYFIGRTDSLGHAWYIDNLINYGHVTEVFDLYKPFPLWHILCSFLYEILGVSTPIHKIMFFTNGIIYSFMVIMTYLVALKVFNNKNIALLSSLFVCLNPDIIFYGMYSISRSVTSFLEVMLILLLLDSKNGKKVLLAITLTFAIIIYHTASIPFIISILLIIYAFQRIYGVEKEKKFLTSNYLITAFVMTLMYWMYYAEEIFITLIDTIFSPSPPGVLTKSILYTPLSELFNYLQYGPLLFFVIIGVLWVMQSKRFAGFEKIFCTVGLLVVVVTFPGPALLLNKLVANFNVARFGEYTFLFISMAGAVGFVGIYSKSDKCLKAFVVLLFVIMCFLSISNDFTASDNPLVKRPFYTYYLTEEENIAFNHVAEITEGYVMSDYVTCRYLSFSPYESKYHILEIDKNNMTFLRNNDADIILIREQEFGKRPLKLYSVETGKFKMYGLKRASIDYYYNDLSLCNHLETFNKIYDSNAVVGLN